MLCTSPKQIDVLSPKSRRVLATTNVHKSLEGYLENQKDLLSPKGTPVPVDSRAYPPSSEVCVPPQNKIGFTPDHLDWLNEKLAGLDLNDLLRWCFLTLPNLAQVSSFGPSGMIIIHRLQKLGITIPTIFLDTLHHFPETLDLTRQATKRYQLDFHV